MKSVNLLVPIIREAVDAVSAAPELFGAIVPRWLAAAIPKIGGTGGRISKLDFIALLYIAEVIDAHRAKKGAVFWRGNMYQINRHDMATRFRCNVDDISQVQSHFRKHGWITAILQSRRVSGEYAGKASFVVPNIPVIVEALKQAQLKADTVNVPIEHNVVDERKPPSAVLHSPLKPVSSVDSTPARSPVKTGLSPKATEGREKTVETLAGGGETDSQKTSVKTVNVSTVLKAPRQALDNNKIVKELSDPTADKAKTLVGLFTEAIRRHKVNTHYTATAQDNKVALSYFRQTHAAHINTLLSAAITAWEYMADNPKKAIYSLANIGRSC